MRFSNEDVFWCRRNSFAHQPTKRLHLPYRSRRTLQRVIHHHHFAACSIAPLVPFISFSERNCRTKSEIRHIVRGLLHIILHHNHFFPFFHFFATSKAKDAQPLPKVTVKQLDALLWKNFEEGTYATLAVRDVVRVETCLWIPFGDRTGFALFALVGGEHLPVDRFKVFSCEGYERRRRRTGRSQRSAAIADTIESTLERVSRTKTIPRTASFLIIAKRKKKSGKERSKKNTTKDTTFGHQAMTRSGRVSGIPNRGEHKDGIPLRVARQLQRIKVLMNLCNGHRIAVQQLLGSADLMAVVGGHLVLRKARCPLDQQLQHVKLCKVKQWYQ